MPSTPYANSSQLLTPGLQRDEQLMTSEEGWQRLKSSVRINVENTSPSHETAKNDLALVSVRNQSVSSRVSVAAPATKVGRKVYDVTHSLVISLLYLLSLLFSVF